MLDVEVDVSQLSRTVGSFTLTNTIENIYDKKDDVGVELCPHSISSVSTVAYCPVPCTGRFYRCLTDPDEE